ncbi:MAG: 16S rRNA (cytidine(1402)-2'-O)-methyltransferase [Ruminococcaceae bacterium]|nr:16S rRNA (cytidine(1402)-2'-O)-methyltransferase [Oscillospiraceae bacterium]
MSEFEKNKTEGSTIYLVATPIGNLADISERAKKVLSEVDFIAAEDTRNSLKLLTCLGIKKELVSYHEHNKRSSGERIIARVLSGESCAVITDAGMPAISDPGEDIVRLAADSGVRVSVIPGACAAVSALSLSALATGRFCFEGFLSTVKSEREARLSALKGEERTMIIYEAPHKLCTTLKDLERTFGKERRISLCRELTKLNEEVVRTTLGKANEYYSENAPRGEYVLIIEGAAEAGVASGCENPLLSLSPEEHVRHYEEKGLSRMDAIKAAAKDRGMSKSELYKIVNT